MTATSIAIRAWSNLRSLLPVRADIATMRRQPGRDLLAGLTVAVVALPLALGFGVSSGLGAAAGLATAIIAGIAAALLGGSNLQVSGPTGAMTVVLIPIVHRFGPGGVLTVGLLAGIVLIGLACARAGRFVRYVPAPVVEGFTAGIAAVIFLQQLPAALGVPAPHADTVLAATWQALLEFIDQPHWPSVGLAVGVAAVMLAGVRWRPTLPYSLIAVAAATLLAQATHLGVTRIGTLPATLPAPSLAFVRWAAIPTLATSALAVAALAALESLLCATVADGMTVGQRHNPDRELFGQGVANILSPMFGGVPATAAIARTAVNVRSGARSRLASLTHAITLAAIMFAFAPLVAHIPLAALAGVLLATAIRMIEVSSLSALARTSRSDALLLGVTAAATLLVNLVTAVGVGLLLASVLAVRSIARTTRLEQMPIEIGDRHAEEAALLAEHIVAYRFDGPLFFAAAHRFLLELSEVTDVRVMIIRMSRVSSIDATGARVVRDVIERLEHRGIAVYMSGIDASHEQALAAIGILERLEAAGRLYTTTPEAINAARAHVHAVRATVSSKSPETGDS